LLKQARKGKDQKSGNNGLNLFYELYFERRFLICEIQ
jgi:hypothetical protein